MEELKVGDVVRVAEPDRYLVSFGNKVRDRDGTIEREFTQQGWDKRTPPTLVVRFHKRNGRGKEFTENFKARDLVKSPVAPL